MTIQDLGSIGELVAAIATVATLAYLAVQIRQNTTSVRSSTSASVSESLSRWSEVVGSNRDLVRLWAGGIADPSQLEADARVQCQMLFHNYMRRVENAFYQRQQGLLDSDHWQTTERTFRSTMANAGAKYFWGETRARYSDKFVEYVEGAGAHGRGEGA